MPAVCLPWGHSGTKTDPAPALKEASGGGRVNKYIKKIHLSQSKGKSLFSACSIRNFRHAVGTQIVTQEAVWALEQE